MRFETRRGSLTPDSTIFLTNRPLMFIKIYETRADVASTILQGACLNHLKYSVVKLATQKLVNLQGVVLHKLDLPENSRKKRTLLSAHQH